MAVNAGKPVLAVPCNAPVVKIVASADLTALPTALPPAGALGPALRQALPDLSDQVPAAVFGVRSSRAPPRLV
jgi:hypothetical protein